MSDIREVHDQQDAANSAMTAEELQEEIESDAQARLDAVAMTAEEHAEIQRRIALTREENSDAVIHSILDDLPVQDDDDNDDNYADVYEQNDDNDPPTRREGEHPLEFLARLGYYADNPTWVPGESIDDFLVRQELYEEAMEELRMTALTPADHAQLYAENYPLMMAYQVAEDAAEDAEYADDPVMQAHVALIRSQRP